MTDSPELLGLLRQLEDADTPLERLRMLALGWRSVRGLSPAERAQLAARLGTEGAEQLVEKLAKRKGGIAPTVLLEAVHSARSADPGKLRGLLASLKDGEQRAQVVKHGLKTVGERVLAELSEATATPETDSVPAPQPPPPAPLPAGAPPPTPVRPPEPAQPWRPEAEDEQHPYGLQPPPAAEAPSEVAEQEAVEPTAVREPPLEQAEETASRQRPEPAERLSAVDSSALIEAMTRGRNPGERLFALRRHRARLAGLGTDDVRTVVASFPQGWPRRRALVSLFTAGVPRSSAAALGLIRELEHGRDRTWCLSALLSSRALDDETLATALAFVDSGSTRRRLRRRARR